MSGTIDAHLNTMKHNERKGYIMQKSVVLVKPDGLQRGLIGEIITRFERKGLKLSALKMTQLSHEVLDQWYAHHKEKPFFGGLKAFMMQTPIIAMVCHAIFHDNIAR